MRRAIERNATGHRRTTSARVVPQPKQPTPLARRARVDSVGDARQEVLRPQVELCASSVGFCPCTLTETPAAGGARPLPAVQRPPFSTMEPATSPTPRERDLRDLLLSPLNW